MLGDRGELEMFSDVETDIGDEDSEEEDKSGLLEYNDLGAGAEDGPPQFTSCSAGADDSSPKFRSLGAEPVAALPKGQRRGPRVA